MTGVQTCALPILAQILQAALDLWAGEVEPAARRLQTAREDCRWLNQPPTDRQLTFLPTEYRQDFGLTRYQASALLAFRFNRDAIRSLVFGAADGTIRAFDVASGDEKWKFPADADTGIVGSYGGGSTPARGAPVSSKDYGRTLVPFDGGFVFEIDEDGRYKGVRLAGTANVEAPPMITPNSLIVWAASDKNVYGGNSFGGDRWQIAVDAPVVGGVGIGAVRDLDVVQRHRPRRQLDVDDLGFVHLDLDLLSAR